MDKLKARANNNRLIDSLCKKLFYIIYEKDKYIRKEMKRTIKKILKIMNADKAVNFTIRDLFLLYINRLIRSEMYSQYINKELMIIDRVLKIDVEWKLSWYRNDAKENEYCPVLVEGLLYLSYLLNAKDSMTDSKKKDQYLLLLKEYDLSDHFGTLNYWIDEDKT